MNCERRYYCRNPGYTFCETEICDNIQNCPDGLDEENCNFSDKLPNSNEFPSTTTIKPPLNILKPWNDDKCLHTCDDGKCLTNVGSEQKRGGKIHFGREMHCLPQKTLKPKKAFFQKKFWQKYV